MQILYAGCRRRGLRWAGSRAAACGFQARFFGGLDGFEQGDLAVVVEIDADAKLTLFGLVSALKPSFRPRIGSRGAISTAEKIEVMGFQKVVVRSDKKVGTPRVLPAGRAGETAIC
jgi:hypothetical protein